MCTGAFVNDTVPTTRLSTGWPYSFMIIVTVAVSSLLNQKSGTLSRHSPIPIELYVMGQELVEKYLPYSELIESSMLMPDVSTNTLPASSRSWYVARNELRSTKNDVVRNTATKVVGRGFRVE